MTIVYRCACGHMSWLHLYLDPPHGPPSWPCRGEDRVTGQACPCPNLEAVARLVIP